MTLSSSYAFYSDEDFSVRFGGGYADFKDLTEILQGDSNISKDYRVYNLDIGYKLIEDVWNLPFDLYIKGGISHFDEKTRKDLVEGTLYVKLYWMIGFLDNEIRLGLGEGISTVRSIPEVEIMDETNADGTVGKTEHTLNYLEISIDVDLGLLVGYEGLENFYVGYTIKHRSGIFGTFDGVHGGSNYHLLTFEKNF
jgi:outer membrane protein